MSTESRSENGSGEVLRNDDFPDCTEHGRPTQLGDDVLVDHDIHGYVSMIDGDDVVIGKYDGDGEFIVPRSMVPSAAIMNVEDAPDTATTSK